MLPRAVIVHNLAHTRAALAAASALEAPVTLMSAPGAAAYLGAGYFQAMIEEARAEFPSVLHGPADNLEHISFVLNH